MFKCTNCGKEYDGAFCPECGTEHAREIVYVTQEEKVKNKAGAKTWLVAIVIALALGVLSAPDYSETVEETPVQMVTPTQSASSSAPNTTSVPSNTITETATVYDDGVAVYEIQYVYEDPDPESVNTTVNPRIIDVVDPNAKPQPIAAEADPFDASTIYEPVLTPNTVLPGGWEYDYQYIYSGVFARYCEVAYSLEQDPGVYDFALGDMNGDGTYELLIHHPNEYNERRYDVYTIGRYTSNPVYVGTTEPIWVLDCGRAITGADCELYVYDWYTAEELTLHTYEITVDEYGNYSLTGGVVYDGSIYDDEYEWNYGGYAVIGWSHYGVISDGIELPE